LFFILKTHKNILIKAEICYFCKKLKILKRA
jgi:hypothetical protein